MTATQSANLTNTEVSVKSSGTANAGNILIDGGTAQFDHTTVSAEALQASGGNIKVNADQLIFLNTSTFTADVLGDIDTIGGTIGLDPEAIIIRNSQLTAKAQFGAGGTIELIADLILIDPLTTIDVSSQFGTSGTVTVSSPIQNLSGAIAPLPERIVDVAQLVGQPCAAQQGGQLSSFVEGWRDVVPPGPADYLTSPMFWDPPSQGNLQGSTRTPANLAAQRLGMTLGTELTTVIHSPMIVGATGKAGCSF